MTWQDIGTIVGTIGGICGFYSLYQNHQQTRIAQEQTDLMKDQAKKAEQQDAEDRQWAERHENLASMLSQINPGMTVVPQDGTNSTYCLYPGVFTDPEFRKKLETYIVQPDNTWSRFYPRKPTPHELRSPSLRAAVAKAEEIIQQFSADNPKIPLLYYLGVRKL